MKIIVTGGLGSIGQNLIKSLLKKDTESILVIDDGSSGRINSMSQDSRVSFTHLDIYNKEKLDKLVKSYQPDYIYHLAAHFANQNSVDHPYSDINTNVIGTVNLLEAVKESKTFKKFVYASSSCVYGAGKEVMTETDHIYPHETPYAINKFAAELYVKYYAHYFGIPALSIRIFNTYGPGEFAGRYRNVIPNFIHAALHNQDLTITGNGQETRDFTFVSDTTDLMILAATSDEKDGGVYNGGSGREVKIADLANKIIKIANSNSKVLYKSRRDWDLVSKRCSNIEAAQDKLGYNPKVLIDEGLEQTIAWYKSQLAEIEFA